MESGRIENTDVGVAGQWACWKRGSERQRQNPGATLINSSTVFVGNPAVWAGDPPLGNRTKNRVGENKGIIPDICPSQILNLSYLCFTRSYGTEKTMAPHSSTCAWKIPWTEEPGRLQYMGSLGVRHDWATSLSLFTFTHWRRKWQPTPVFLPGESQGRGSLVGCRLWGCAESDTTEAT